MFVRGEEFSRVIVESESPVVTVPCPHVSCATKKAVTFLMVSVTTTHHIAGKTTGCRLVCGGHCYSGNSDPSSSDWDWKVASSLGSGELGERELANLHGQLGGESSSLLSARVLSAGERS